MSAFRRGNLYVGLRLDVSLNRILDVGISRTETEFMPNGPLYYVSRRPADSELETRDSSQIN